MPVAVRTWLRYVVPLTLLAALAFLPLLYVASRSGAAADLVKARAQVRLGWILAGFAWMSIYLLVAGVAPAVRSVAAGAPLSQWRALADGARNLVRAFVPWLIVVFAVALGEVALVIPGFLIGILLSLTGASVRIGEPPPAALVDSVAVVRRRFGHVALIVIAILLANLAICYALQATFVPHITRKVAATKLLPIRTFVRLVPVAIAALSPLAACVLAATYGRLTRRTS
ncbi:MAG TPA: hypothetical protein VFV99_23805 [Kofleriaceae bacterium]|nr:hypothetical protein [Kofleriaceae bacterium]